MRPQWPVRAVADSERNSTITSTAVSPGNNACQWGMEAETDGRLVDKTTGVEMTTCTGRQRKLGVILCFVRPRLMFFGHWLSSANSEIHLVSSDASRVTIPVEDIETFDPSRPSLSSDDSILLLKGNNPGYPDVAPKAFSLCADSPRPVPFPSRTLPLLPSSYPINLTGGKPLFFSSRASLLLSKYISL